MSEFASWLWGVVSSFFTSIYNFFVDLPLLILDGALGGIASLIEAISVPSFLASGLAPLFAGLPSGVQWFLVQFGIPNCLAVLAAGLTVRLVRKAATLFQW